MQYRLTYILPPRPGECVCLDCEFADGRELLELAVCDVDGSSLYDGRFKPRTLRRWMTEPHHITPEMVRSCPRFSHEVPAIQRIMDRARWIIGFSVEENDLPKLAHEGIARLGGKKVGDVRDLFWLVEGRDRGLDLFQGRGLAACCADTGVTLGDDAHSAGADTRATLECFVRLLDRMAARCGATAEAPMPFADAMKLYRDSYAEARLEYDRAQAAGHVYLLRRERGVMLKTRREPLEDETDVVADIPVADRKLAENDLRNRLRNKAVGGLRDIYRLSDGDIARLRRYTNTYDPERHQLVKQVSRLAGHLGAPDRSRQRGRR